MGSAPSGGLRRLGGREIKNSSSLEASLFLGLCGANLLQPSGQGMKMPRRVRAFIVVDVTQCS